MTRRIDGEDVYRLQPVLSRGLAVLGDGAEASGLDAALLELIYLRASQINGCAYCVNMHSSNARRASERQERLDLVAVWREAPCFTARERAALAWAEAVTTIAETHVSDDAYAEAKAQFSDEELVNLTTAVIAINGWNRVCVTFRVMPPVALP